MIEPMLLSPAGKDYLWGGIRLKTDYGKEFELDLLAETWECSTHQDGESIIVSGAFSGKPLSQVLKLHPEFLGSRHQGKDGLPILVKFIDAAQNLSVQVHPDDAYAQKHENQNGKTELWYVLDAEPGAELIYGFEHDMTRELLLDAIETGQIEKHLHKRPVFRGDVLYIPSGMVHAIGAGVLLAEIQQSSNVTYRVYDYDRIDKNGNRRKLHIEKAIDVMNMNAVMQLPKRAKQFRYYLGYSEELLCCCPYFEVKKLNVHEKIDFTVDSRSFQVMLCTEGSGRLSVKSKVAVDTGSERFAVKGAEQKAAQKTLMVKKGDCVFFPAGIGRCSVDGELATVKIRS